MLSFFATLVFVPLSLQASFEKSDRKACCLIDAGYDPLLAVQQADRLATHSWEYGTVAEALLELFDPHLAVFSPYAFPSGKLPTPEPTRVRSLSYAGPHIRLDNVTLIDGDGAAGDPASLGVSALLVGQTEPAYHAAAVRQAEHLLFNVPKWANGAISHREAYAELWADFIYMGPPFLAYYAVATDNTTLIEYVAEQCDLYREVLQPQVAGNAPSAGAWRHIIGPVNQDLGIWSTGNGWAAMGMTRVLATLLHWPETACRVHSVSGLLAWIGQILKGAMHSSKDEDGLLRNYLNDTTWFGEISGTAAITTAVYRTAVLQERLGQKHEGDLLKPVTKQMLAWADANREAIAAHVDPTTGIASPAVNPLGWSDRNPYTAGSPEGESFLILLYAAYRDYILAGDCQHN
ncbi:hypothetical protein K431DRAFT_319569 [Polychaeton citri CBS 116435]|uniref:Six-hairpin glycosidase n=1 Tax=Polychaeton citri CBS 116435 TaxID=1314669 RepID=A0A9P4QD51_9PEZI|nr:hypothetical protein K431DRAFT_319569 [Polychaeton citri CBS 116435]